MERQLTAGLAASRQRWISTHLGPMSWAGTRLTSGGQLYPIGDALIADTRWAEDLDRVREAPQLARMAGVGQVFVGAGRGHCSRAVHSKEVSEIAANLAAGLGLRVELAAAIGLAHDCGHPPLSHVGEAVIRQHWPAFNHADYAADFALEPLNLTAETLLGVRNHSWSTRSSGSAEAEIVRWADRIAYLTRDRADAIALGIAQADDLPVEIRTELGTTYAEQRAALETAVTQASRRTGFISMEDPAAVAMAHLRQHNYDTFYVSIPVQSQAELVARAMGRALVRVGRSLGITRSLSEVACLRVIQDLMTMDDATLLAYADQPTVPFAFVGAAA
ncbi:HD domain-containing protein [Kribbella sp. CA-247076]|uniref:HD domain-containing protein n=1 Tax=Kribbella sp. CA-247076 TaxID=3239941 RepID=UPI003D8CC87C